MSAPITVGELCRELSRHDPNRVVVLRVRPQDEEAENLATDQLHLVIENPSFYMKNARQVWGQDRDILVIEFDEQET